MWLSDLNGDGTLDHNQRNANLPEGDTVACVGDIYVAHPILKHLKRESPELLDILAAADLVVGNFQGATPGLQKFGSDADAQYAAGGPIPIADCVADLKNVGFDMLARASKQALHRDGKHMSTAANSSTDKRRCGAVRVMAEPGASVSAARAPTYVSGAKARASLAAWTTGFAPHRPAVDGFEQARAHANTNTLGITPMDLASSEHRTMPNGSQNSQPTAAAIPKAVRDGDQQQGTAHSVEKSNQTNSGELSDAAAVIHQQRPDRQDLDRVFSSLRRAMQTSDFSVAASHTHAPDHLAPAPSPYLKEIAYGAINHGADMFFGHGGNQIRSVEIRHGKPIFYVLGNFCLMGNMRRVQTRGEPPPHARHARTTSPASAPGKLPTKALDNGADLKPTALTADALLAQQDFNGLVPEQQRFASVIALTTHAVNGHIRQIKLPPIELHRAGNDAEHGLPRLAEPTKAIQTVARLKALSAPLGTAIWIDLRTGARSIFPSTQQPATTSTAQRASQ